MSNINFDHNATARPTRHVLNVLRDIYTEGYNNPSSVYSDGRKSLEMIEKARLQVATALGCNTDEIIFTSGASESNSTIQNSVKLCVDKRSHHSIQEDDDGEIIAIPMIISETGECLLDDIKGHQDKKYFVDLTQAVGRININLRENSNIIFASASGHKFGGILGCGILYIKKEYQHVIKPLIHGSQEHGMRGGTYNVPAIVCFGEAIEDATNNLQVNNEHISFLINYIYKNIKELRGISYHTNTINITFNNLLATTAVQIFDNYGFDISAGSACNSKNEKPSEAYLYSGYTEDEAMKTIRISLGIENTIEQAIKFVAIFKEIIDKYDR